jgi:hypothetical protein
MRFNKSSVSEDWIVQRDGLSATIPRPKGIVGEDSHIGGQS